jgi:hypothetical protein
LQQPVYLSRLPVSLGEGVADMHKLTRTVSRSALLIAALVIAPAAASAANIMALETGDTATLSGSQFDVSAFTSMSAGETATGSGSFIANVVATGSALLVLTEGAGAPPSDWLQLTYSGAGNTETITAIWHSDAEPGGLPPIPMIPGVTPQFLAETGGVQQVTAQLFASANGNFPSNITFQAQSDIAEAVPEPSTWAMMLIGFLGLGFAFKQSRRKVSMA